MKVTDTARFIDDSGNPVEEMDVAGSRFDRIAIKILDDGIHVRAHEEGTDEIIDFEASLTEQLFKGVQLPDEYSRRRRDVDNDLLDALHSAGYTLVDTDTTE